jgi:predicted DnaQ family exonuclease/DinG family helicase
MPKLFDLLSERTNKEALKKLQKKASDKKPPLKKSSYSSFKKEKNWVRSPYIPNYVALDFETTGLDAKNNRIIEIGAVKFTHGKPGEEFSSLINPDQPIPAHISELTGIKDSTVADAPFFEDVIDDLLAFIGKLSFCGHQVEFDFNFLNAELKRAGKEPVKNWQLDTAVLSRLLLPDLSGYTLAQVSDNLDIKLDKAHRALYDAKASGYIAGKLIPKLYDIPEIIRLTMGRFAPPSVLKTVLLKSVVKKDIVRHKPEILITKSLKKLTVPEEPSQIDKKQVEKYFSSKSKLSDLVTDYRIRPFQIKMARSVTEALNGQSCFVAEAGTGTGKSLAYLIPAALWSQKNKCRILVSTYTKNLQDQLISKDLPIVSEIAGKGFTYCALKGRANYLCRFRWNRLLAGELGNLSSRERQGILPLIKWAEETTNGDIEEQNQFNRRWFPKVWSIVSADSLGCLNRRCPLFKSCFLQHARQKALSSHVVVINHSLFFSEICAESSFLGKTGPIIFDEAHHLESCGHRHLRTEIDTNRVNRYIELLNNLIKLLEKRKNTPQEIDTFKQYKNILKRLRKNSSQFLAEIFDYAKGKLLEDEYQGSNAIYQFAYCNNPFNSLSGLSGTQLVVKDMQDMLYSLQRLFKEEEDENYTLQGDISACLEKTSQFKADLDYVTSAITENHVFWLEGDLQKGWVKLCGVPLDIGTLLYSIWKENHNAVIFTSATMMISGSIEYFKQKVGLTGELEERTFFEVFQSPFYSEQLFRCAVKTGLTPDSKGYDEYIAESVIRLLNTFDKNILVLFTANSMLYNVYKILRNSNNFPNDGMFLAQGFSGTRTAILDKFREARKCVLLGTSSFWEGIDAPGSACEIVIMPRLPFTVPTHPLTQALAARAKELYGDSFYNYSVPEAVIRFRQGAGRLIRTTEDSGAFIVLDGRIISKAYGKLFINSLEGEFVKCSSIDEMISTLSTFF